MCRLRSYQDALSLLEGIKRENAPEKMGRDVSSWKFDKIVTNSLNDYLSFLHQEKKGEEFLGLVSAISLIAPSHTYSLSHRHYLYQIVGEGVKEGKRMGELCKAGGITKPMFFEMLGWLGRRGEGEAVKEVLSTMEEMGIDAG